MDFSRPKADDTIAKSLEDGPTILGLQIRNNWDQYGPTRSALESVPPQSAHADQARRAPAHVAALRNSGPHRASSRN